jgi:hypothetical protein
MPEFFLRPEAGPIPYWKHHKRAQKALDRIIGALRAAARSAQVSAGDSSIDTNRSSRIFFVSGEPGSGKSTLYLTLKEMLGENAAKYSEGCDESLGDLRKAVRWLDTLDLEVAGDEGENLLAAVLVRLIEVLLKPDSGSNTVLSKSCEEAIKSLEELATDIGIAWEGNLRARAGELDPDTYSVEVMRTQRARLGVNERLRKALDELAKHQCYDCDSTTLFVLPVDDFYLKPDASLQLLRLLRMISIPRLFFLVMGDVKTVEALFTEKSLADWTAVAGARTFTAVPRRLNEAQARARELRAHYLRKLLPPGQRAEIEAMDWDEALKFKPEHLGGKEPVVGTLGRLLKRDLDSRHERIKAKSDDRKIKLLEFLVSPYEDESTQETESITAEKVPPPKKEVRDKPSVREEEKLRKLKRLRKPREAYTALQILDAPSREIMDLWFALHERNKATEDGNEDVAPGLISVVENFVKFVIEEQNFLNEDEQEVLQSVLPTRHYSARDIQFNMDRLSLDLDSSGWTIFTEEHQTDRGLWVRKHRAWKLTVNRGIGNGTARNKSAKSEDVGLEDAEPYAKLLPPRPTAWIVLLHDLAFTWKPESVTGNLVERLCQELNEQSYAPYASFHSKLGPPKPKQKLNPLVDLPLWAVWFDGSIHKHFRVPRFKTFRELDRFLYVWSQGIEWLEESEYAQAPLAKRISYITSLWALAGRIVLLDTYKDFADGGDDWYRDFAESGDAWYKEFMDSSGARFVDRFNNFKNKRNKNFVFPSSGSERINEWIARLDDWDSDLTELENEVLEGPDSSLQPRPKTSERSVSKTNRGARR